MLREIRNGLALVPLCWTVLDGQQQPQTELRAQVHNHVVETLRGGATPLPAGDTLVSWTNQGPILYHIISVDPTSVRSSLMRNDPFVGVVKTEWSGSRPTGFEATWWEQGRATVQLRGRVVGSRLLISGSSNIELAVPDSSWTVADYGMDEHFVPLLPSITAGGPSGRVLVFRPYKMKWDTVSLSSIRGPSLNVVTIRGTKADSTRMLLAGQRLLYVERSGGAWEERPLELTPLDSVYHRLTSGPRSKQQ